MNINKTESGFYIAEEPDYSLKGTSIADYYRGGNGKTYNGKLNGDRGYTSTNILPELTGKPFNNVAMGYIHGFHPTSVRASTGCVTCDASTGRVTVILEVDNITIRSISQEIEVAGGSGSDLWNGLRGDFEGYDSFQDRLNSIMEKRANDG